MDTFCGILRPKQEEEGFFGPVETFRPKGDIFYVT